MDYDTRVTILSHLKDAEEAAMLGRWDDLREYLRQALQIVEARSPPEWRPRHGGEPRPMTRDPVKDDLAPDSVVPMEDPFAE